MKPREAHSPQNQTWHLNTSLLTSIATNGEGGGDWQRGLPGLVTISNRDVKALLPKKISGALILEDGTKTLHCPTLPILQ